MKKIFMWLLFLFPLTVIGQSTNTFEAGRDYLVLTASPSPEIAGTKNKVHVIEFFSYGCPACFKLDPFLEQWLSHPPHDIVFERIPVIFDPSWEVYAKTSLIVTQLKQDQKMTPVIFRAIHEDNLDLNTKEAMASFLNSQEIKKETFLSLYSSPSLDITLGKNKQIVKDLMIFQIPAIVIDGKYKVDPSLSGGNFKRLIDTVNYLIKREKEEKDKTAAKK